MTHGIRRLIRLAEDCGLTYVGMCNGKAHYQLVFENAHGQRMVQTASHGARSSIGASRQVHNTRAQFKRFARGETHGLIVLPTSGNGLASLLQLAS